MSLYQTQLKIGAIRAEMTVNAIETPTAGIIC